MVTFRLNYGTCDGGGSGDGDGDCGGGGSWNHGLYLKLSHQYNVLLKS